MILVNNPGTWSAVYPPLLHAEWNGWTYTDTIFPFFLFIAGVAMALSLGRRQAAGAPPENACTAWWPSARAPIVGPRARPRPCELHRVPQGARAVARRAPADRRVRPGRGHALPLRRRPRLGPPRRSRCCSATGRSWARARSIRRATSPRGIDHAVFGAHTWKPGWDPEGLLSTLPAIATTLLGVLAGEHLRAGPPAGRIRGLFAAGAIATAAGLAWGRVLPVNKSLWTSSYALLMSGLACVSLAACIWIVDVRGWKRWAAPLVWLGRNAIAAFTLSTLGAIALIAVKVAGPEGKPRSLWNAIYRSVFDRFADPRLGSVLFALTYLALWTAIFGVLYRRKVFIKI